MAIATTTISSAVAAGMNEPGDYISRFVFAPTVAEDAARAPGTSRWKATAYKQSSTDNLALGEQSLKRAPLSEATTTNFTLEDYSIFADEYAVKHRMDLGTVGSLDRFGLDNLEQDILAPHLVSKLLIDEEVRASALIKDTGTFSVGANLTSTKWTSDSVNPLSHIRAAYDSIKKQGTDGLEFGFAFSRSYWDAFVENPYIKEIFGDNVLSMTKPELEQALTNLITGHSATKPIRIRVATGVNSTANKGQTANTAYIYSDHALMFARPAVEEGAYVPLRSRAAAKCYVLREPSVDYYEQKEIKAAVWEASHVAGLDVFDADLAYYFQNAV